MASVTQPPAAATGKGKGKKSKGTKLDIEDFVDSSNFKMVDASSWADEMENEEVIVPANLPSAPKSALGPDIDFSQLPPNGPFRLSVANLQYEVTEEQLADFFSGLNVSDLRVNSENGRTNGTASLTLTSKNDVLAAMELNNKQLNNRSVRIFMANMGGDRYGDRDGGRRGGGRSGGSYIDNTPSNWRSATRPEAAAASGRPDKVFPPPTTGPGSGGFGGGRDRDGFGSRSRYGDGDGGYQRAPRNDYGGGRRDYGDGGERRNDDFGRRDGGRRDRYGDDGGRSSGNWGRGPPRDVEAAEGGEPSGGNWRRDGPRDPPPVSSDRGDFDRRPRDNGRYNRDDRDGGAPPPARDSYGPRGGGGGDGYRRAPREDDGGYGRDRDRDFERRGPPPSSEDTYDPPRRGPSERVNSTSDDYEPPRSFAPPPRDRAMSGRSERSNEDRHDSHLPLAHKDEEPVRRGPAPLRPEMIANLLAEEPKPSSYNSIFGGAKPVDTLKREMEIEKKLAEEKAEKAEKEAALREAALAAGGAPGSVSGISPAGSSSGDQPRRERGPPRDGGAPRMRNGEPRGDNRGPRRDNRYDDRNGGGDRDRPRRDGDRRGGDGRRDGGGPRLGGGNRDGPPQRHRNDLFSEEPRRGGGGYGGGDRRPGDRDNRYEDRPLGGQPTRMFRGGGGGGGGRDFDNYRTERFLSDSDDVKILPSNNKYAHLGADDTSD